jgi:two-component system response regulator FixJ
MHLLIGSFLETQMTQGRPKVEPLVYVVDDDSSACRAVGELVQSFGHQVRLFESPVEFLDSVDETRPGCVVLDVRLPEIDGMEVQRRIVQRRLALPIIILTAYADTPLTVRSLRNGALTVLDKPFRDDELWSFIQEALHRSEQEHRRRHHLASLESRLKKLAPQDRSVLQLMLQGMKNRSIAKRLDVSLRTVENRRRRVFQVMDADSVAQLTRMVVEFEHNLMPSHGIQESWLSLPFENVVR